jgi:hypothetical protein
LRGGLASGDQYWSDVAEAILGVPSLQTICLEESRADLCRPLFEKAVNKPHLQSLQLHGVDCSDELFQGLVLLTQLTYLDIGVEDRFSSQTRQLFKLSCLRVLHLRAYFNTMDNFRKVVEQMSELQELRVHVLDGDVALLDSILATLPMLTGVTIWRYTPTLRRPGSLLGRGIARVRDLSLLLADLGPDTLNEDQVGRLVTALTRLKSLEVLCHGPPVSKEFLSNLHLMPYLTKFCAKDPLEGFAAILRRDPLVIHVSAHFMERLPVLRHLELVAEVLALEQWDDDVKYIAALTGLTTLMISHDWSCNGGKGRVTFEQVKPLTTLRLLNSIKVSGPLKQAFGSRGFSEAMESLRRAMGFPPTSITLI